MHTLTLNPNSRLDNSAVSYFISPYMDYMGHIRGRSNACITCLANHVNCGELHVTQPPQQRTLLTSVPDEAKPTCYRCIREGVYCEGYSAAVDPHVQLPNQMDIPQGPTSGHLALEADIGSVIEDDDDSTTLVESSSSKTSSPNNHHTNNDINSHTSDNNSNSTTTVIKRPPRGRPRKLPQATKKSTGALTKRKSSDSSSLLTIELSYAAFQEPICVTFLVQNFLGHLDTGRQSLLPAWDVDNVSGTARDSIDALALAFFGKAHHQQKIVDQGAACYGKALQKLRHDLNDQSARWSSSVLLSAILLARYELVSSTGSAGWIRHAGGVERLFELRGPQRHRSLEERHIFEAARPIIAIKAITDCKRTFLEQQDWLTIPWAQDPGQKSAMNQLIDIFCITPGLLEDSKRLHTSSSFKWDFTAPTSPSIGSPGANQDHRLVALRHRTQECYTRLQRWKATWDRSYPSAVQPVNPSHFPQADLKFPEDIFSYALTFPNFLRANEYQLYNTVVFFVSSLMLSVAPTSQSDIDSSPSVSDLLSQRYEAAYDICRAVPYDLFEKHGGGGAYLLMFPLLTNLRLFGERSDEGKWIKHVLGSIANKWGLEGERKYMALEG